MMSKKVIAYFDGFNYYEGLRKKYGMLILSGYYSKELYANRDIAYYKLRNYSGLFRISWNSLGSVNGR